MITLLAFCRLLLMILEQDKTTGQTFARLCQMFCHVTLSRQVLRYKFTSEARANLLLSLLEEVKKEKHRVKRHREESLLQFGQP